MTSREKAKGSAFEERVARFLSDALGIDVRRLIAGGRDDQGDLWGLTVRGRPVAIECKNHARMELGRWVDEADREAANAGACCGVVVHHRRGCGVAKFGRTYVTMTLDSFVELTKEA